MTTPGGVAAGIDVGGSNLRVGVVSDSGEVLERLIEPTPTSHSAHDVVEAIVRCLRQVATAQGINIDELSGIGIGIPGPVDPMTGVSRLSPNLGWTDVPFEALVRESIPGPPVAVDNDVRVVTFGEWQYGAGKGVRELMCVTVGTGVGSGLILRGEPYRGSHGIAGEVGHIQLDPDGPSCGCGNRGCVEQYASAAAVAREAQRLSLGTDGAPMSALEVAEAAARGSQLAAGILSAAAAALARGVAAAVNLLNLERVIIGGGLSRGGPRFWEPFEQAFRPQVMPPHLANVTVVPAALGDDAGILGGAWMVRQHVATP